jgi:replication factor C small subunit
LGEVIGQEDIVRKLQAFVNAKNVVNMIFSGPPGTGKTTCALALARDLYGEDWRQNILEMNASDERGIDIVRGKIKDFARTTPLGGAGFKIIFLDEADALTPEAQHALRRTMELYSGATRFILSCNWSSKVIEPIQSRCATFHFHPFSKEEVEKMISRISEKEGLKIDQKAIDALIYVSEGDMRKAVNVLQSISILTKQITEDEVHRTASAARPEEIAEMISLAIEGDFMGARERITVLSSEYGLSGEDILLQIYREVISRKIPDENKVKIIDRIGEYNFRMVEGANERLQLEALLAYIAMLAKG